MHVLQQCFDSNREWARKMREEDPDFFARLQHTQQPDLLWIGCSDSRLPPNEIIGLRPGELFVHRNVANVVVHTDMNCLSVLQYAIEVLHVRHIIVVGHYGCGGVRAAMQNRPMGLIDNWLRHVRDVHMWHHDELSQIVDGEERENRLCELNVATQVANVCSTTIVQEAWRRSQPVTVHGWIYSLKDGLLKDLEIRVDGSEQVATPYRVSSVPPLPLGR